ncbi:hypothetical protein BaRGS_00018471 [Batillaria attramentaria]|uniref:Uncharacterized protein n=1 Tax=Batillaria attramentaria TaxID=370345 RepID=A0ABD0KSY0_9CAEN
MASGTRLRVRLTREEVLEQVLQEGSDEEDQIEEEEEEYQGREDDTDILTDIPEPDEDLVQEDENDSDWVSDSQSKLDFDKCENVTKLWLKIHEFVFLSVSSL